MQDRTDRPNARGSHPAATMGKGERIGRVLAGLLLLGLPLAWYGPENVTNWGFIGLYPLLTGMRGWCPLKSALLAQR